MEFRIKNEFCIYFATPFKGEQKKIADIKERLEHDLEKITLDDEVKKIDDENLTIKIQFKALKKIIAKMDLVFNNSPLNKKKMSNILNFGNPIMTAKNKTINNLENEIKSNLTETEQQYRSLIFKDISFNLEMKIYKTEYVLLFLPYSYNSFCVSLVSKSIFKKYMESDEGKGFIENVFFFALNIDLSTVEVDDEASKSIKPDYCVLEDKIQTPTIEFSQDKVECCFYNTFFTNLNNTFNKDRKLINDAKKTIHFIAGNTENKNNKLKYFIGKSKFSDKIHILTEVVEKKWEEGSVASYCGKLNLKYIYGDLLFPFYLEAAQEDVVNFNICTDSEDRTKFGYFTKGILNSNIENDEEFKENNFKFDGFFSLDNVSYIKEVDVSKEDLPFPFFKTEDKD